MSPTFALLVPVKSLNLAKSRLGASQRQRRELLMRAFALDAITAAATCASVSQIYVVSDEPGFDLGDAVRLPDEGDGDLNRALHHASLRARRRDPAAGVAAMCADLPCLSTADLDSALALAIFPRWFVADASGSGTTLLAAAPGVELDPHFGAESARRHEESGARPVRADVPTLRMDVDTEDDLRTARRLGLGLHTTRALAVPDAPTR